MKCHSIEAGRSVQRSENNLRRGYLLIEAMVASACLAVVLSTTLTLIGQARAEGIYAGRRNAAISLARQKMDALVGTPELAEIAVTKTAVDTEDFPGIFWAWSVTDTSGAANSAVGLDTLSTFEIVVTVTYPSSQGERTFTLRQLRLR
jgi:hypothetical protein